MVWLGAPELCCVVIPLIRPSASRAKVTLRPDG
jgi:hypothetical protein